MGSNGRSASWEGCGGVEVVKQALTAVPNRKHRQRSRPLKVSRIDQLGVVDLRERLPAQLFQQRAVKKREGALSRLVAIGGFAEGPAEARRGLALTRVEVSIPRAPRQAVGLAHRGTDPDLDARVEIGRQP